jgi:hypothetical protein
MVRAAACCPEGGGSGTAQGAVAASQTSGKHSVYVVFPIFTCHRCIISACTPLPQRVLPYPNPNPNPNPSVP